MQDCTLNILGTQYDIIFRTESDCPKLKEADGYFDCTVKQIVVVSDVEVTDMTVADTDTYRKSVLRHEIVHAFLYESGLNANTDAGGGWAVSEEIVDWIALQFPKMLIAFKEADAL